MIAPLGHDIIVDGIVYRVGVDAVIVMNCESLSNKSVKIPAEIEGKPVRHINDKAFKGSAIQIVELPENCRYIGEEAFANCENLVMAVMVNLPKMAGINIGQRAFADCKNLKTVDFRNGYLWLEDGAFVNCEQLEIISGKLFQTRDNVFRGCESLLELIVANHAHLASKTFGNSAPQTLSIEGMLSRPSRNMFRKLKPTKILCKEFFPFWDLVYEGYNLQLI